MQRTLLIATLLVAPALIAQNTPNLTYGNIQTPEIRLGSDLTPTTITVSPVVELSGLPSEPQVSNAQPASTELLATRHFDYVVSPVSPPLSVRGNMADTSISLGEYARHLREEKRAAIRATPDAMARPADSR
jgi:hypothetical protein